MNPVPTSPLADDLAPAPSDQYNEHIVTDLYLYLFLGVRSYLKEMLMGMIEVHAEVSLNKFNYTLICTFRAS